MPIERIAAEDIKIGHFIVLKDIPWIHHPFMKNSFIITDEKVLNTVKSLGTYKLYVDLDKSQLTKDLSDKKIAPRIKKVTIEDKKKKLTELQKSKQKIQETEKHFSEVYKNSEIIINKIFSGIVNYAEDIEAFAASISDKFSINYDTAICVLNTEDIEESHYCHSMNVAILSALLAKNVRPDDDFIKLTVIAATFHDIGKMLIPQQALAQMNNAKQLTQAQKNIFEKHPFYSIKTLSGIREFPPESMTAIYQHHENIIGTGYPLGVSGDEVSDIAQIIALTDKYDNYINRGGAKTKLPPHKALSLIYTTQAELFRQEILEHFIKMLGIYPPGSILQLEDESIALVLEIDEKEMFDPSIMLFDATIPKRDAPILKLKTDTGLKITKVLAPEDLNAEQKNYLSIRTTSILGAHTS